LVSVTLLQKILVDEKTVVVSIASTQRVDPGAFTKRPFQHDTPPVHRRTMGSQPIDVFKVEAEIAGKLFAVLIEIELPPMATRLEIPWT
jgi:hypothetical protein